MRIFVLALLAALTGPALAAAETITGTVTYLQRIMLPPGTTIEVALEDTSLADAPAKSLATFVIDDAGAPPYRFAFAYDPDSFDDRTSYTLRATARNGDTLLMTTDTVYPVVTRGAGTEVEMVMKMVAQDDTTAEPGAELVDTHWKITSLNGAPVTVTADQRQPHLILRADGTYAATAGCNMLLGGYTLDGGSVSFQSGPTTLMACIPPLDAYESALIGALQGATGVGIDGTTMQLIDGTGGTLATFEATKAP